MFKKLLVMLVLMVVLAGFAGTALATGEMSNGSNGDDMLMEQATTHEEKDKGDIPTRFLWTIAFVNGLAITTAAYLKYARRKGEKL